MWQGGTWSEPVPGAKGNIPFMLPGWTAEKMGSSYVMISPRMAAERRRTKNGKGSAARISNGTRPQDLGVGRCSSLSPGTRLAHSQFFDRPVGETAVEIGCSEPEVGGFACVHCV